MRLRARQAALRVGRAEQSFTELAIVRARAQVFGGQAVAAETQADDEWARHSQHEPVPAYEPHRAEELAGQVFSVAMGDGRGDHAPRAVLYAAHVAAMRRAEAQVAAEGFHS